MSWFRDHFMTIVAVFLPVWGLAMGGRLAVRLWRVGWGPVPRKTMLSAYGGGVLGWLIIGGFSPKGPLYWSILAALAGALVPTVAVILTRPEDPRAVDPEI